MKIAIIVSTRDPAGMNIKDKLLKKGFEKTKEDYDKNIIYENTNHKHELRLYTTNKETLDCENIDKEIKADFFVFATRHQSVSGIPSLSCHAPGNWGKAEMGGQDNELCVAWSSYLKLAYQTLHKNNTLGFDVVMEVTHHGPYVEKPIMFIEIGSTEEQWVRDDAGEILADSILEFLSKEPGQYKIAVGIGGLHTCPNFNKIVLKSEVAIGHVCPKYMLDVLDKEMLKQAITKTVENVDLILLDWKGLGGYKQKVRDILSELGVEVKRTREFNSSQDENN